MKRAWRRIIGKRVELKVNSESFANWPFSVEKGTLICDVRERCSPVTLEVDDKIYPLNGAANQLAAEKGWEPDVLPIRRRDPMWGGWVSLGPIIQHALRRAGWD